MKDIVGEPMIVMKFGGSSIANPQRIKNVVKIVGSRIGKRPLVVVSGLRGVTDDLIKLGALAASGGEVEEESAKICKRHLDTAKKLGVEEKNIRKELDLLMEIPKKIKRKARFEGKDRDELISLGERMSARIIARCMNIEGIDAVPCDAYDIGMVTDSNFGNADVVPEAYGMMKKSLEKIKKVPVITGFVGKDADGNITTLGRGGSDYTACIVGAAVKADEIQIWTNVNGVMTADPRIVENAKNIKRMSFEEEAELEFLGAETLHPKGIRPAMENNINVRILNSMNPSHRGTMIERHISSAKRVISITSKEGMSMIKIEENGSVRRGPGLSNVLSAFNRNGICIDYIAISKEGITAAVTNRLEKSEAAAVEIRKTNKISVRGRVSKISIVGNNISEIHGIHSRITKAIEKIDVLAMQTGVSCNSLSVIVDEKDAEKAIRFLHREFFGE